MPISIEEFESRDRDDGPTNAERVLRFLARNEDKAFRAVEIAEATGVVENSVHPVLHRLEERGLVRHREPYWAVGDPDAVREATVFHSVAAHLDEEFGPERRSEWLAARAEGDGRENGCSVTDVEGEDDT